MWKTLLWCLNVLTLNHLRKFKKERSRCPAKKVFRSPTGYYGLAKDGLQQVHNYF